MDDPRDHAKNYFTVSLFIL